MSGASGPSAQPADPHSPRPPPFRVEAAVNGPVVHPRNFKRLCMGTKYPHIQYQIFSTIGRGLLAELHVVVQQFKLNPIRCPSSL